ncbi:MAG TPA: hypothetical protein PKW95_18310 [bacterium]|nr:hypothetical protein [bacterium]
MKLRTVVIVAAFASLLAVLAGKSLTMMLSAFYTREVALERRQMQMAQERPSPAHLAEELERLDRALYWSGCDSDALYLKARNLHRLALLDDEADRRPVRAVLGERADDRDALLTAALAAYDRAIACNALVSGARFWRLSAQMSLAEPDRPSWREQYRDALAAALKFDPQDAVILRAAGDLALAYDDEEAARSWHRQALALRLDGLEEVAAQWLDRLDGPAALDEVIPRSGEARRRLAQFYFGEWLFADAREVFATALALEGKTPLWPEADETISDGDFRADENLLLHPWEIEPVRNVRLDHLNDKREGSFLRASFRHGPFNWYHVFQRVPVEPGRRYRLRARVRVEGFVAVEEFGVEAVHPFAAELYSAGARCRAGGASAENDDMPVSAGRFVDVAVEFDVPLGLRLLTVRLRRFGVGQAEKGSVDFAAVSLKPVAQPEAGDDGEK